MINCTSSLGAVYLSKMEMGVSTLADVDSIDRCNPSTTSSSVTIDETNWARLHLKFRRLRPSPAHNETGRHIMVGKFCLMAPSLIFRPIYRSALAKQMSFMELEFLSSSISTMKIQEVIVYPTFRQVCLLPECKRSLEILKFLVLQTVCIIFRTLTVSG